MRCPNCGSRDNKVVDSRTNDNSNSIRRRRECLKCNTQFVIKSNLFYVRKRLNEEICLNCNPIIKNFSRKVWTFHTMFVKIFRIKIYEWS